MLEYFVNGGWMSWDEAHNMYGYTRTPCIDITAYNSSLDAVTVRYEPSEDKYWFYGLGAWGWWFDASEITGMYFQTSGDIQLYHGSSASMFEGYSNAYQGTTTAIGIGRSSIVDLADAYSQFGLTQYPCEDWIVLGGVVVAWYDSENDLYWDDREGAKAWTPTPPEVKGGGEEYPEIIYAAADPIEIVLDAFLIELPDENYPEIIYVQQDVEQTAEA